MRYLRYLKYVLRHKWFVFIECARRGLVWRGLVHDMSKLRPSEFFPYANFFYGKKPSPSAAFDFAWLLHQKRNRHHWQWWILPEDNGGEKVMEMPMAERVEMLCDWKGAGRAQGTPNTQKWYLANRGKMRLGPYTRSWIERELGVS